MKKSILLFTLLFSFLTVYAQTVTWDGGGGNTKWEDNKNWDNDMLPCNTCDVTIENHEVVVYENHTIKSLKFGGTTQKFTIASTANLHILGASNIGLEAVGAVILNVEGILEISNCSTGLSADSATINLQNSASVINVHEIANYGIESGFLFNNDGGTFSCSLSGSIACLRNQGIVKNSGVFNFSMMGASSIFNDSGSSFTNENSIVIDSAGSSGIGNYGKFINNGDISISNCGLQGIYSISDFTNAGTINIDSTIGVGFQSGDTLINSGLISVKHSNASGMFSNHTVLNQNSGSILVKNSNKGLDVKYLENSGLIQVNACTNTGLIINSSNDLFNEGEINLTHCDIGLEHKGASFYNSTNGHIHIDSSASTGFLCRKKLVNEGLININNSGGYGLYNQQSSTSDSLLNLGKISIFKTGSNAIRNGEFTSALNAFLVNELSGVITIDSSGDHAILNYNKILNKGHVAVSNDALYKSSLKARTNSDSIINSGIMILSSISMEDNTVIENTKCGEVIIATGTYIPSSSRLINDGLYINKNKIGYELFTQGYFINNGVFMAESGKRPSGNKFTNSGIIFEAVEGSLSAGVKELNFIFRQGTNSYAIAYNWYLNRNLTVLGGQYGYNDNSFLANQNAIYGDTLFFEVTNFECTKLIALPILSSFDCSNPEYAVFTQNVSTDWHTAGNWHTERVPGPCTIATIPVNKICTITTGRKARALRIISDTGSVLNAELGVVLEVKSQP